MRSSLWCDVCFGALIALLVADVCSGESTKPPVTADSLGMVLIHPGTFTMGSPPDEPGRSNNETQHEVTLTKAFYMSDHTVTQQEWQAVMRWNPSDFSGATLPVEKVTWYDCVSYCNKLSAAHRLAPAYTMTRPQLSGNHITSATVTWNPRSAGYRLPTEAEREYACRAGRTTAFCDGPITSNGCTPVDPSLDLVSWYCGNSAQKTHPVKGKQPNAWGLYDMHGNVWEWCWDCWNGSAYGSGSATDPTGQTYGSDHAIRGGGWYSDASGCRSACRDVNGPGYGDGYVAVGLRVSRTAP